jgi:hypothetical protein
MSTLNPRRTCARPLIASGLVLLLVLWRSPAVGASSPRAHPKLPGSFLQPALGDIWTPQQWRDEFRYMEDASLDQILIQWTADSKAKTTVFPSNLAGYTQDTQHDVVERALQAAGASGGQLYLGLQINGDWWTNYIVNALWLRNEAKIANVLADDLWKRYQQHPSFAGWYLPFEVDNVATTSAQWDNLVAFYRTVGHHLHKLTPGKPVVISPLYDTHAGLSSSLWQTMWEYVLQRSSIDVLALQDGVGAGHATKAQLPEWFGAVGNAIQHARPTTQFWADTETYTNGDATMPIHSIVNDMRAVPTYVSHYVSFSFNHYLSPQQVNPLYYRTYVDHLATGKVEEVAPTIPGNLTATAVDSASIRVTWTASTDNLGVVGYKLLRNGRHVTTSYCGDTSYVDSGLDAGMTYSCEVRGFDAAGNNSPRSNLTSACTPPPHLYPTNTGLGKPYTSSMPADPGYPDTGNVDLTAGILGSTKHADAAWQGRAATQGYKFTIDLGSLQVFKEIRSHWPQDDQSGILFPVTVNYFESADKVSFVALGQVTSPMPIAGTRLWWYTLTDLTGVSGRYVQVRVAPGSNAGWTFVDEIEVRQ